jgi:uracil-DNA glycosylase family 4
MESKNIKIKEALDYHVSKWSKCVRCNRGHFCKKPVLGRGKLPCDILFVGGVTNKVEDKYNQPATDLDGRLLYRIIEKVQDKIGHDLSFAITNVIACSVDSGPENVSQDELVPCSQRFSDFVDLASPKGIVLLGNDATHLWNRVCSLTEFYSDNIFRYQRLREYPVHTIPSFSFLFARGGSSPKNQYYKDTINYLYRYVKDVFNGKA